MRHAHLLVVQSAHEGKRLSLRASDSKGARNGHPNTALEAAGFREGQKVVVVALEDLEAMGLKLERPSHVVPCQVWPCSGSTGEMAATGLEPAAVAWCHGCGGPSPYDGVVWVADKPYHEKCSPRRC